MGRREKHKSGARGSAGLNKKRSEEFLLKNGNRQEVIITESGIQYEVIREGQGVSPSIDSKIKVDQRIMLVEGTVLDDTYKTGCPDVLSLSEGIEGYVEILQLMQEGGRYKFVVPSDLAWGKKGTPSGKIGPYAALIFDVALLKVI